MKWIDGSDIDIKSFSGEELCEKLSLEMWEHERSEWLEFEDFIQTALFIIDFDTEMNMNGIFTFLENSIGHYVPNIIKAFREIGDYKDAEILSEICRLAPPDLIRGEFLDKGYNEYDICDDYELNPEVADKIELLESRLYLNSGFDMWSLFYDYLDKQIAEL
ncbi:MAG: DUF4375 domain-containing protein [Ruminococcus sp.]|nr:DUF4375 domain-containing protein [Ruminococcus sp.]